MASHMQQASRNMDDRTNATSPARFLRATLFIEAESSREGLATDDRAVAWPRLNEPATTCNASTSSTDGATDAHAPEPAAVQLDEKALESMRSRIVGELYKSSYHRVYGFARRLVSDDDAEEITHEAYVRLLRVRNLETMSVSVAYLLRIVENIIRRRYGRAQRYHQILELSGRVAQVREAEFDAPSGSGLSLRGVGHAGFRGHDDERMRAALGQLTPSEQSVVRLIVCEGLDYQAAAISLDVPISTITNWKHRALVKLKQLVEVDQPACGRHRGSARVGLVAG